MDNSHFITKEEELLLGRFFHDAQQPIADNGFTQRVMAALDTQQVRDTRAALRLRRWNLALNIAAACIVAFVVIVIGGQLLWHINAMDADELLVQFMLAVRTVPQTVANHIPNMMQVTAFISLAILAVVFTVNERLYPQK